MALPQGEIDYRRMLAEKNSKEQGLKQAEAILKQEGMKMAAHVLTLDGFLNWMEGKPLEISDFKKQF